MRVLQTTPMGPELKIGFLGAGKMALALAKGVVKAGLVRADSLIASDPVEAARTTFTTVLLVAVKPDQVNDLLLEIKNQFTSKHLLISIAAGIPITRFETALGPESRVVRVMPNAPAL